MKALYLLLIILFLTKYSKEVCDTKNPTNRTDCILAKKAENETKCCYVDFKIEKNSTEDDVIDNISCRGYNQTGYENMRAAFMKAVETLNNTNGTKVLYAEIDCGGGKYLFVSILLIYYGDLVSLIKNLRKMKKMKKKNLYKILMNKKIF